ncbi:hypothetical protein NP233_g4204 [Leucocoprinus birnbaumii]|uniref:NACHT domain-containing protein n=1 Tax=Leucocoprinus birnbaumii TaxID=56174 RepID=A0AAD5YXS4_9AGAR|nr:hypothetical protein NP233_g4204 [Leucocoprinus birnbaumii]
MATSITFEAFISSVTVQERVPSIALRMNVSELPTNGTFSGAHSFTVTNPIFLSPQFQAQDNNLESFARQYTIPGAHYNSSARFPPPRCHPGTRDYIVGQTLRWFLDESRSNHVRWLTGPAGAGKSAIMQTLAEQAAGRSTLGAALFLSASKKLDQPLKLFTTLAYQLATKYSSYRNFLCDRLRTDPSLPEKSIATQFSEFFVEPFARHRIHGNFRHIVILLDGLDECNGIREQIEIAGLITYFAVTFPSTPLVWVIAGRSEPHLTSFFSRKSVSPHIVKEELQLDSTEACQGVERYLRDEFQRIKDSYLATSYLSQWPTETQILKVASAGTGLFAFASTVIGFVDDNALGNPISQLLRVLSTIDKTPQSSGYETRSPTHPMKHLDALYTCILSQVPFDNLPTARVLLRHHLPYGAGPSESFALTCNWLGMTPDIILGALHCLSSVFDSPTLPDSLNVLKHRMGFRHQSFCDYLSDPVRSGEHSITSDECIEQDLSCCLRILCEVPRPGLFSDITVVTSNVESQEHGGRRFLYQLASARSIVFGFNGTIELVVERLHDTRFIHSLKVMEYNDELDFEVVMRVIDCFDNEIIRNILKRENVIEELPIASIDLNVIQSNRRAFVRYCSDKSDPATLPANGWCKEPSGGHYVRIANLISGLISYEYILDSTLTKDQVSMNTVFLHGEKKQASAILAE